MTRYFLISRVMEFKFNAIEKQCVVRFNLFFSFYMVNFKLVMYNSERWTILSKELLTELIEKIVTSTYADLKQTNGDNNVNILK